MRRLGYLAIAPAAAVVAAVLGFAAPALSAPPFERTVTDPVESDMAYDVRSVKMSAAPAGEKAKVVVKHGRRVAVGDGIDLWIDTDDDRLPDLYVTGFAFSEYAVYKARGWQGHGRNISDRGCASLKMTGRRSVLRFDPSCLAPSARYSVSVRSFVQKEPKASVDYVPAPERLTKKVQSYYPQ